ncbi:Hypothetical predicted protein [Pelobates cultripes]|uniref:Uncharacterized protein n=1 Tax=Pelobates cultripes TaxID=61616 RepID=A0AAD1SBG3_PELCU|nr:Hypothetical predicted protein [Pelobates cultripes]
MADCRARWLLINVLQHMAQIPLKITLAETLKLPQPTMSQPKTNKCTSRAEKLNFWGQKSSSASEATRAALQGCAEDSDASNHTGIPDELKPTECLTRDYFKRALEAMSTKLIHTWQSTADQLRKEALDLSTRTSHTEKKCKELASAHNDMADYVQALEHKMEIMETRMVYYEDRARRNNLRLRGIPESVLRGDLPVYVWGLMHAYAPGIPADMLLVDWVQRVTKPKYLLDSAPRNVLLKSHYFHVKELIL